MLEVDPQFQQKILRHNINRILAFSRPLIRLIRFIEYILSWKDKVLSCLAIIVRKCFSTKFFNYDMLHVCMRSQ